MGNKIIVENNKIYLENLENFNLKFFGKAKDNKLFLTVEECLYLMEMKKYKCFENGKEISIGEVISKFIKFNPKIFVRYNTFRDWKDRGLFLKNFEDKKFGNVEKINYPSKEAKFEKFDITLKFLPNDLISFVENGRKYFKIFSDYWLGQLGVYKQHERGELLKFDIFETIFLKKFLGAKVINLESNEEINEKGIFKFTKSKEAFKAMYEVYEDWRLRGFVVKTGYKFGTHFRIYFPGVSPVKKDKEWVHSKHVLHVFPKFERMLISEWSRAIRVAHSVRKTFIIGIPGMKESDYIKIDLDFIAFHRDERNNVITPDKKPNFAMWCLGEDEYIGGAELASALKQAYDCGLDLLLAINGRESDVTYYLTKQINLPNSKYQYYEIRWLQP